MVWLKNKMNDKSIKNSLKERKKRGGCGMWKSVGIPYMYKHYKEQLTKDDIDFIEQVRR